MAAANILSVGQFFLLNNSFKCLNLLKKDFSIKKLIDTNAIPPKPKRPASPYLDFQRTRRSEVMADNPGKSFTEISKIIGAEWKNLSEREKNKYRENFLEKHTIYKNQLLEYNEIYGDIIKENEKLSNMVNSYKVERKNKKILQKQYNKPQFPASAYRLFMKENVSKSGSSGPTGKERFRKCAEIWSNMPDAEKDKYMKLYQEKYEQYKKDLSKWEEDMMQEGKYDLIRPQTMRKKISQE